MDTHLYELINGFAGATPMVHGVMAAYALWAGPSVLAILLVAAWWHRARRRPDAPVSASRRRDRAGDLR